MNPFDMIAENNRKLAKQYDEQAKAVDKAGSGESAKFYREKAAEYRAKGGKR